MPGETLKAGWGLSCPLGTERCTQPLCRARARVEGSCGELTPLFWATFKLTDPCGRHGWVDSQL